MQLACFLIVVGRKRSSVENEVQPVTFQPSVSTTVQFSSFLAHTPSKSSDFALLTTTTTDLPADTFWARATEAWHQDRIMVSSRTIYLLGSVRFVAKSFEFITFD